MNQTRTCPVAALLLLAFSAAAAPQQAGAGLYTPDQHYQLALEEQSQRNYRAMLRHLRTAAQSGLVEAQETLGMVLVAGQAVYGPSVRTDHCEAFQWFLSAAKRGSELGLQQVHFLARTRTAPGGLSVCKPQ